MTDGLRLRLCYALGALAGVARATGSSACAARSSAATSRARSRTGRPSGVRAVTREFIDAAGRTRRRGALCLVHRRGRTARARRRSRIPRLLAADAPAAAADPGRRASRQFRVDAAPLSLEFPGRFVGLYKPARNARIEAWLKRRRSRFGARLVPAKSVLRELAGFREAGRGRAHRGPGAADQPREALVHVPRARTRRSTWARNCWGGRCARR